LEQLSCRRPDKKRFINALRHIPHPEIPYFETEFSAGAMGRILGKVIDTRTYHLPPEDHVGFLQSTGIDMAYLCFPWFEGRKWHIDSSGHRHYVDGLIKHRKDLKNLNYPSLDIHKRRIEGFLEAAEGSGIGLVHSLNGAADIITSVGMQDYYLALYDDPGFIDEFMDIYDDKMVYPVMDMAFEYRPDAVMLSTELCYKDGMMMSPELADRFVFKRLEKQVKYIRTKDVPVILHSDGDNSSVMDRWIAMGFSAIHPVENCGKNDIFQIKEKWGDKICLMGNMDLSGVLMAGTPDDVVKDTLEHIEKLSGGGGYICGSSHDINDSVPFENLRAMIKTVTGYIK
jgi:uroporphyrinogen decarboxylase